MDSQHTECTMCEQIFDKTNLIPLYHPAYSFPVEYVCHGCEHAKKEIDAQMWLMFKIIGLSFLSGLFFGKYKYSGVTMIMIFLTTCIVHCVGIQCYQKWKKDKAQYLFVPIVSNINEIANIIIWGYGYIKLGCYLFEWFLKNGF